MTNFLKKNWLIILIFLLALILRFYKLDSYPALNADEAAIGYNAYSLIKTGMDEHGNSWPIHFQSFNDYKPGLYFYLVLPFVKFLGLNELAVRLPNAFLGALTVLVLYLTIRELKIGNSMEIGKWKVETAEIAALFLSISPWHIQFSRGGWEVNVSTFLITLGVLMFLKALKKPGFLSFTLFLMPIILSLYTYHAARIVGPLLGGGLLVIYRKEFFVQKNIKLLIFGLAFLIVSLTPFGRDLIKGDVLSRAAGVGLFADQGPINRINEQRGEHTNIVSLPAKLLHNKVVNYGLAFAENWQSHFTGEFLFMTGDVIQRNRVPETGAMYVFDIIFLGLGLISITKVFAKGDKKSWVFILFWLLTSPLASALTFQSPNALRAENMTIPLVIISAFGLTSVLNLINVLGNKKISFSLYLLTFAFISYFFARYEHMYWVHMSPLYPFSSQYGLKELATFVSENKSRYSDIFVTGRYDQPYILFLFYTKYPPEKFQFSHTLTSRDEFGFSTVSDFGKYHFGEIDFPSLISGYPNSLIIGTPDEISKEANIVKRIYGTNGYEYFDAVAN